VHLHEVEALGAQLAHRGLHLADPGLLAARPHLGGHEELRLHAQVHRELASGLSAPNATYATLGSAILSSFQQAANTISSQSKSASSQQTFYQQTLASETGVNMDTELANLVAYQNSYAASAHVISSVSQMFTTLLSTI